MTAMDRVVFRDTGREQLRLTVTPARGEPRRTAILYFHGGGWRGGSPAMMAPIAEEMAAHGHVGLAVQYRLLDQAPWPAQIEDVRAAIRWTRRNAGELGVNPNRIVLWGSSAGAQLSLLAAGTPEAADGDQPGTQVAAVIAEHPPTAFHVSEPRDRGTTPATSLMGPGATAEAARLASPISHVGPDFPPTLLLHGTSDSLVHHSQSLRLFEALRAARAPVDLHLYSGHDHGFAAVPSLRRQFVETAAYFLDRLLIDPAGSREETLAHSFFARRNASPER